MILITFWFNIYSICQLSQSTEYLILDLHLELLSGTVKGQQLQQLVM